MANFENHRVQSSYEKSLIAKTFIFSLVNNYSIFFYTAFLKRSVTGCLESENGVTTLSKSNSCEPELQALLRSYFVTTFFNNFKQSGSQSAAGASKQTNS